MSALLTVICQAIVAAFLDWGKAWVAAEHAKADEWAAATLKGQLAAKDRADQVSKRIDAVRPAWSPEDEVEWNHGAPLLKPAPLILACLLLTGCFTRLVYVDAAWPVIALPARPVLTPGPAWTDHTRQLATYATALEQRIAAYNTEANAHNAQAAAAAGATP